MISLGSMFDFLGLSSFGRKGKAEGRGKRLNNMTILKIFP